jgi:hypothetical protein
MCLLLSIWQKILPSGSSTYFVYISSGNSGSYISPT